MQPPLKWKIKDDEGNFFRYKRGDVVSKNGKLYIALRSTTVEKGSPEHGKKAGWKEFTEDRIKKFNESSTAPINPLVGDEWYNTNSGILYKFIDDGTSTQWVEI
tara:strand:- start:1209 stop:1520 length:312 start_codon:yes stop_codon:yes gene_type:complete